MDPQMQIYERITELVSLLSNSEFRATVRSISEKTETSLSRTREDLGRLHKLGIRLYPSEAASSLSAGDDRFDDEVLELDSDLPIGNALLFLRPTQKQIYLDKKMGSMLIKDTTLPVPDKVRKHFDQIEAAIRDHCYIRFRYRSPYLGFNENVEIAPLKLFHNTTNNLYYCISFDDKENIYTYRLDRILYDVHLLRDRHCENRHQEALGKLDYVWGAAFENNCEPVHVKVEILIGTPNLLRKIESETRMRKYASIRKECGRYIYEDDVIGLSSFRTWLFSYGSSLRVLAPKSLAQSVLASSRLRLLNYEDGNRFHQPEEEEGSL